MTTTAPRSDSSVTVDTSVETYSRPKCVVFFKTDGTYGGLSNMCGGFPLSVNGIEIRNSESLYQSCRFPDHPHVQELILDQTSPLLSKNVSKPHRKDKSRTDWDLVQVEVALAEQVLDDGGRACLERGVASMVPPPPEKGYESVCEHHAGEVARHRCRSVQPTKRGSGWGFVETF